MYPYIKIKSDGISMSKTRQEPGILAVQAHLSTRQSTHGAAPEASAGRLIRILRSAYPQIKGGALTASAFVAGLEALVAAQGSLIVYLQSKIGAVEEDIGDARDNAEIAATIQVIDAISDDQRLSSEDKKKIWIQMKAIASTCPGLNWDKDHRIWSSNRVYNALTMSDDIVIASPAETMNLVCAALLDTRRYMPTDGSTDLMDLGFRLASFCAGLLQLQTEEEAGQFKFCAAGRQHEMLFLLNMSYLDKPRDQASAVSVRMFEYTGTFLIASLSDYIDSELSSLGTVTEPLQPSCHPEATEISHHTSGSARRAQVVLDSMRWQANLLEADTSPLITWLDAKHHGRWKVDCISYLSKRCIAFGMNPTQCKLQEVIESLPFLTLPSSSQMLEPMMDVIFRTEPFKVREQRGAGVVAGMTDWDGLVVLTNAALARIKSSISAKTCESEGQLIRDFYTALEAMQSLNHYKDLRVFVGAEEGALYRAREVLEGLLIPYFTDFNEASRLTTVFASGFSSYITQLKVFMGSSQVDFVENCFAYLMPGDNLNVWMARLQALRPAGADKHPLTVSDEVLERWHQASVVADPEGGVPTIDVSPYQINRILLHGLLVSGSQWSALYAQSLALVTAWLLQPKRQGDAMLNALKKSYPGCMLSNLLLLSLLHRLSFFNTRVYDDLTISCGNKVFQMIIRWMHLLAVIIQKSTYPMVSEIIGAMQGHWGELIQHSDQLSALLSIEAPALTATDRSAICSAVEGRLGASIQYGGQLGDLIKNASHLSDLLSLSVSQLNAAHRALIWSAVEGRLHDLIQFRTHLDSFFNLSLLQLNAAQRKAIWSLVERHFNKPVLFSDRQLVLDKLFTDMPIEHFIEILKFTTDEADILKISKAMGITTKDVVAYIKGLDEQEKAAFIKMAVDKERGSGLFIFFRIQPEGTRELSEMMPAGVIAQGFFSRTADAYPDPDPTAKAEHPSSLYLDRGL